MKRQLVGFVHMNRRGFAYVLVAVGPLLGCTHQSNVDDERAASGTGSSGSESSEFRTDLDTLKAEHEREQQRLTALRASNEELHRAQDEERQRLEILRTAVEEAERKAQVAKEESAFHECKATVSEISASAMFKLADCKREDADYQSCRAARSQSMAVGTGAGCGIGILLGAVTAGASLLMCAAGAGAGYVVGGSCEQEPVCLSDEQLLHVEMASRGIAELPMCGGAIGAMTAAGSREVEGWLVDEVEPTSTAAEMGIEPGDLVARVNGTATDASCEVAVAVQAAEVGQLLVVEVLRDGVRRRFVAPVKPTKLLGVKALATRVTAETIVSVQLPTPGHVLQVGDVLIGINEQQAPDLEHLRAVIRLLRAGTKVTLEIDRGPARQTVDAELQQRSSSSEL